MAIAPPVSKHLWGTVVLGLAVNHQKFQTPLQVLCMTTVSD